MSITKQDLLIGIKNQNLSDSERDAKGLRYSMNIVRFNLVENVHNVPNSRKDSNLMRELANHRRRGLSLKKEKAPKSLKSVTRKKSGEQVIIYTDSDLLDKRVITKSLDYLKGC
jgi:hypothetical protein